ncbi:hypothetical protein Bca4012_062242 [Brassica carinata]|uniref:Uncharacterized protein n=1 Tax=Brassica carinata TaxID=52824 RepID=A0A8X7S9I2_BRACI|nr:hypothetical protein Bca52824_032139 [Brassica carinata]
METQVVKIEKSHKESSKGTLRRVCLDEDDQDDRNELALSLARQSDPERKQLSTNGVKVNQLHGHRRTASATDDIGSWIVVSDDGVLHKALASHLSDLHEKFPENFLICLSFNSHSLISIQYYEFIYYVLSNIASWRTPLFFVVKLYYN